MSGLRSGGPKNDNTVDGVVIRPGVQFASGENYMITSFKQRESVPRDPIDPA